MPIQIEYWNGSGAQSKTLNSKRSTSVDSVQIIIHEINDCSLYYCRTGDDKQNSQIIVVFIGFNLIRKEKRQKVTWKLQVIYKARQLKFYQLLFQEVPIILWYLTHIRISYMFSSLCWSIDKPITNITCFYIKLGNEVAFGPKYKHKIQEIKDMSRMTSLKKTPT